MGLLSDIYISSDDDAVNYDTAPQSFAERAQFNRISSLELSTLWAIMRGVEWDDAMMDDFTFLLETDGGERVIQSFPSAMVAALSQLTPERIRDVSAKWVATDQFFCSPSELQPVVEEMTRLARAATASGRGLYLWNCI
jgi:hypothetical protein